MQCRECDLTDARRCCSYPARRAPDSGTPCRFDQHAPRFPVARFGDAATAYALAARLFRRHQAKIGHKLARRLEAAQIADGCNEGDDRNEIESPQRPQRIDEPRHRPVGQKCHDPLLKLIAPLLSRGDSLHIVLKNNLVRWLRKDLARKPFAMPERPVLAGRVNPPMPQQKRRSCWRERISCMTASMRARTRSRMAS